MTSTRSMAMKINFTEMGEESMGKKMTFAILPDSNAKLTDEGGEEMAACPTIVFPLGTQTSCSSSVMQSGRSERSLIGLPRVTVTGIDYYNGESGRQFFF